MNELSKGEFVHFLLEKLNTPKPGTTTTGREWSFREDEFKLVHESGLDFSLSASYEKYSQLTDPQQRQAHFNLILTIIQNVKQTTDDLHDWSKVKEFVYPCIRSRDYFEKSDLVSVPFYEIEALRVGLLIRKGTMRIPVTLDHLDAWKVSGDEAVKQAISNLEKATPTNTKWSKTDVGTEPDWRDDLCAARILLPHVFEGARPCLVGGDIVVIIPSDDKIVVTSAFDQLGLCFFGDVLLDYKNPSRHNDDDDEEEERNKGFEDIKMITDIALRLVGSAFSISNQERRWVVYTPQEGEGRIPRTEEEVELMFEAIDMAAQKMAATIKKCNSCNKASPDLKTCSRCKIVWYCSRECQVADWPKHKNECKPK